ncbi:MAG: YSC84-related protein [Gemmatimonadota bacterium]
MKRRLPALAAGILLLAIHVGSLRAQEVRDDVTETIETFRAGDSGMASWFNGAYGYAVFPNVGKGGFIVGAGHGTGQVFKGDELIGKAEISMLSVGLQIGGQSYSEVIFFENAEVLQRLIDSKLEFGAAVSAVALTSGASADASYRNGVAVFTRAKGGAMAEASMSGQKFDYTAYEDR